MRVRPNPCLRIAAGVLAVCAAAVASAQAPIAEREAAVRAVFSRHVAEEIRMLICVAAIEPQHLEGAKSGWLEILGSTRDILERGGFPKESIGKLVADAQPDKLMSAPLDREITRASCVADKAWEDHLYKFMSYRLVGDVREIVEGRR